MAEFVNKYMNEVTGTMIRISVAVILLSLFIVGLIGLIKAKPHKKAYVALLVIPLLLVYSMYFSGAFRRSPLNENNIKEILQLYNGDEKTSAEDITTPDGVIRYNVFYRSGKYEEEIHPYPIKESIIEKLFSKKGTIGDITYTITDINSDKGGHWEASYHVGYMGLIYIQIDETQYIQIDYTIERDIDICLGFFYAPPVFERFSFL